MTTCTQVLYGDADARVDGCSELRGLREIQFNGCDDMEIGDFRSALHLLDTKVWDTLERVVVENCHHSKVRRGYGSGWEGMLHYSS